MKTEHLGVDIEYNEATNQWDCEIRGRARHFESLKKAKEGVEAEPKTKSGKVEKMQPIPVFKWGSRYGDRKLMFGAITSFAEPSRAGAEVREAWVMFNGARSKDTLSSLYMDTPESHRVFEEAKAMDLEAEGIRDRASELRATINPKAPARGDE